MLDGVPLGQLGIGGINNNDALSLTILAAITFTPDLPPTDTNPAGHRPCFHSLDFASMLPKAVVIGCWGRVAFERWMPFSKPQGVTDHDRTHPEGQTSRRKDNKAQQEQLPPLDAGKYAVPPQVSNLDRRPHTTPVNHRLLLESGRDVNPTGRGPLNQEEHIRRLCRKPSKRGGTPDEVEGQTD